MEFNNEDSQYEEIKESKELSSQTLKKLDETVRMFVDQQMFGRNVNPSQRVDINNKRQDEDIQDLNEVLQWCFAISEEIDITVALEDVQRYRIVFEQWMMPNFQSIEFNEIVQSILNELEQISPSKATEVKKIFEEQDRKQGIGIISLNVSSDLLGYAHNMTVQHIRNTSKKIFVNNGTLFSQIGPK
ncbi:MAG: hypothetical protein EZS28_054352, partial [Streblomastix strix]